MATPSKGRRNQGFTLIEVLIAITLTSVITAAMSGVFQQTVFIQKKLDGKVAALVLGQSKLAELEYGSEPALSGQFPGEYAKYTWVAAEEESDGNIKRFRLVVEWKDQSQQLHQATYFRYSAKL